MKLADALMAPTTIYVKPMLDLLRGEWREDVHAMAHITGGGLTENIIRVIPEGLGLDIEASAIVLPPVFDWLQREGAVPREEMWRTFNCGVGFVRLVVRQEFMVAARSAARSIGLHLAHRMIPRRRSCAARGDERVRIA